jgi:23S rRNA pseudouridine1911/1915/1917 synthase
MKPDSEKQVHHVPQHLAGSRLDATLASLTADLSRSAVKRLIDRGCVTVDGELAKPSTLLVPGQRIEIDIPPPERMQIPAQQLPLDIVYEDEHLLVVNKPPAMAVHPGPGHERNTLVNALLGYCDNLSTTAGYIRPGLVHRLDRGTSGLVLVAKNDQIHRRLSAALEQRTVVRVYQVLAWGWPEATEGTIITRFGRDPKHRTRMAVMDTGGREAITDYRMVERYRWSWTEGGARVRIRQASYLLCGLQTGRTHQIRVHMAHLRIPIVADADYGDLQRDRAGPDDLDGLVGALRGHALHAARLVFTHPATGKQMQLQTSPPTEWAALHEWFRQHQE